jgi:hypothetical protein
MGEGGYQIVNIVNKDGNCRMKVFVQFQTSKDDKFGMSININIKNVSFGLNSSFITKAVYLGPIKQICMSQLCKNSILSFMIP